MKADDMRTMSDKNAFGNAFQKPVLSVAHVACFHGILIANLGVIATNI